MSNANDEPGAWVMDITAELEAAAKAKGVDLETFIMEHAPEDQRQATLDLFKRGSVLVKVRFNEVDGPEIVFLRAAGLH